jgi:hypothetical protein
MILYTLLALYIGSAIYVFWKFILPLRSILTKEDVIWSLFSVLTPIVNTFLAYRIWDTE